MGKMPDWVISQRRAQGLCEICGQQPAATVWAGTGQEICFDCCEGKRLANLPEADREAFMDRGQAEDPGPGRGSANTRGAGSGTTDWPGTVNDGVEAARKGALPSFLKAARRASERAQSLRRRA